MDGSKIENGTRVRMNHQSTVARIIQSWPPELRLLLSLASPSAATTILRNQPAEVRDWDLFLRLVERHRLAPAIQPKLGSIEDMPARVREKIEEAFQRNRLIGLQRMRQIIQIHGALDRRGISSMALKGVLAGMDLYGDAARRRAGDLDVLINPGDFHAADQVLGELGFRPQTLYFPISRTFLPWVLRQACDKEYFQPETQTALELHWRFTRNSRLLAINAGEAFARARKVQLGGFSVQTPGFEDQLIYLCVHGAAHIWFRLFWLVDVASMIPGGSVKLQEAANLFRAHGLSRIFHQTVLLARDLFGVVVPQECLKQAEADRPAVRLELRALSAIAEPVWNPYTAPARQRLARHFYTLSLRTGFAYRMMHFRQAALSEQDWRELRLPAGFEWLYYFTRPVLWLRRRSGFKKG